MKLVNISYMFTCALWSDWTLYVLNSSLSLCSLNCLPALDRSRARMDYLTYMLRPRLFFSFLVRVAQFLSLIFRPSCHLNILAEKFSWINLQLFFFFYVGSCKACILEASCVSYTGAMLCLINSQFFGFIHFFKLICSSSDGLTTTQVFRLTMVRALAPYEVY